MLRDAILDARRRYRYLLVREWDENGKRVAFVLLNPSTADASQDDPTIRRCIGLAKTSGFGSLAVVNLFAFRSTDPGRLAKARDPIGPDNDNYILNACTSAQLTIAAWGNHGRLQERGRAVCALLATVPLFCFGKTDRGEPRHPLYLRQSTAFQRYEPLISE